MIDYEILLLLDPELAEEQQAEVIARVAAEGFHLLDAAPQRINAKDTPIPYHPNLWSTHRPNAKEIARKARALLRE